MALDKPHRFLLGDVKDFIICQLCNGYLIDATTITECMHSFCKTCIVIYLRRNKYCPICDVQVYKENPYENLHLDHTLQDIVYKIVPGLFRREMEARQEFYRNHPEARPTSIEDAGQDTSDQYTPDDNVSLSLVYYEQPPKVRDRRYFYCPAAAQLLHLIKLLRIKYEINSVYDMEILYFKQVLNPRLTLMEMIHIFGWRRRDPVHLMYRLALPDGHPILISYIPRAIGGSDISSSIINPPLDLLMPFTPPPPPPVEVTVSENLSDRKCEKHPSDEATTPAKRKPQSSKEERANPLSTKENEWKEVQLQISESGVMSFLNVTLGTVDKNEAIGLGEMNTVSLPSIETITIDDSSSSVLTGGGQLTERPLFQDEHLSLNSNNASNINSMSTSNTTWQTVEQGSNSNPCVSAANKSVGQSGKNIQKIADTRNKNILVEAHSSLSFTDGPKTSQLQAPSKCEKGTLPQTKNVAKGALVHKTEGMCKNHGITSKSEQPPLPSTSKADNNCSINAIKNLPAASSVVKGSSGTIHSNDNNSVLSCASVCAHAPKQPSNGVPRSLTTSNNINFSSKHSTFQREQPKMAVVTSKPSLPPTNGGVKNSASTCALGCRAMKLLPRSWNPTLPRLSIPTTKYRPQTGIDTRRQLVNSLTHEHKPVVSSGFNPNGGNRVSSYNNFAPIDPPRFFRMRNMPRYLGNPASGVKPMYQVASAFNEPRESPEPSSGKKPVQRGNNVFASSTVTSSTSTGFQVQSFQPKAATSTSSYSQLSLTNSSRSPSSSAPSSSNSSGMFQNLRNSVSGSVSSYSTFNFNPVSSNYVSFADLCKNNSVPVSNSQSSGIRSGDTALTFTNQTGRSFSSNSVQESSTATSQTQNLSNFSSPAQTSGQGAFHLLPPSVDMIFKPQHRMLNSSGSRYQCSTPAVQRVPATSSLLKNSNQTANGTQVTVSPSCVAQTQPNKHPSFNASHEIKLDETKASDDTAPNKAPSLSLPGQSLPKESSDS